MMKLTANNLENILKVMDSLGKIPGEVKQVEVDGHNVYLSRVENGVYLVRGISRIDESVNRTSS